ncbi:MAG: hypothetical protein AB7P07_08865 [Hyphomonadaceae bacterium]
MLYRGILALAFVAAAAACATSAPTPVDAPVALPAPDYVIADPAEASPIFAADDDFMSRVSPADISVRLRQPSGTKAELQAIYASAPQSWSAEERARLEAMIARRGPQTAILSDYLPERILLVKTDGSADTALPHTRANAINLGQALNPDDDELDRLFFHELFHVLSRENSARHEDMYALINFRRCAFTPPPELADAMITNPDAPRVEWGAPLGDGLMVPVLVADPPRFDPVQPDFGSYFDLRFYRAQGQGDACALVLENGAPVAVPPQEAMAAIHAAAGRNTTYVLHPEEILADNFAQAMMGRTNEAPDPQVQHALLNWLDIPH